MVIRIDLTKQVRAPAQHILKYFMNIKELPNFHPEYIKKIRIIDREDGDHCVKFHQEGLFHGNQIKSINKLTKLPDQNTIRIEIIEGFGSGSITTIKCQEMRDGITRIELAGNIQYGLLERVLAPTIQTITQKTMEEDIHNIEQSYKHS